MISIIINSIKQHINPILIKNFDIKNIHQIPSLIKITISTNPKEKLKDNVPCSKQIYRDLYLICNQKPNQTKAKKSVSNFNIQKKEILGYKVSLNKKNILIFLDKFILYACLQIRHFKGFPIDSFDKFGNYSVGVEEQFIFNEISFKNTIFKFGMNINFSFINSNKEKSKYILDLINFRFLS